MASSPASTGTAPASAASALEKPIFIAADLKPNADGGISEHQKKLLADIEALFVFLNNQKWACVSLPSGAFLFFIFERFLNFVNLNV